MAPSTRSNSEHLTPTRARQGRPGRDVLFVLLAALVLVVIGFFATWGWKANDLASTEPNNAREQVDAQPFDVPPPAAATRQNYGEGGPLAPQNQGNPGQPGRAGAAGQ